MNFQINAMVYYDRDDEERDAIDFLNLKLLLDSLFKQFANSV